VRLRAVIPRLPRHVWVLHGGLFVNTFGGGLVTPFLLIYLHLVRDFRLETAGLVAGAHFAVAIVFGIVGGSFVDRVGGRAVGIGSLALLSAGFAAFPLVTEPWHAFALMAVAGAGRGAFWPSYSTLLAVLTPREHLHDAYAVQRVAGNLGIALGALAGGLIASTSNETTFAFLFLGNAASFAVFIVAFLVVPSVPRPPREEGARPGSYGAVLRDRSFLVLVAVNAILVTAGIAQLNSVLPVFAKSDAGVSETAVGLIFVANAAAIVLAQLPISRLLEGRRRMQMLAVMALLWALSWLVVLGGGLLLSVVFATVALVLAGIVFALGECIHGVVQGPLVADLAPEHLRGRYMALWLTTAQMGFAAGPAVGGYLLARSPVAAWLAMAGACLLMGIVASAYERRIPAEARLTPRTTRAPAPA
jgi:MFS family permease